LGVYSLSEAWDNELLWAHYTNSHTGFCIEYELDDLILEKSKTVIFPKIIKIIYSEEPPVYSLEGMDNITFDLLLNTLIGTKSIPWGYEDEIRILFKNKGKQEINSNAIKSIIFGYRASDKDIKKTISLMPNRLSYHKIEIANNYQLLKKPL